MKKIIFDTDFLLSAVKFKVDILSELNRICDFNYTVNVLDKTIEELKGKKGEKLALGLIKARGINIVKIEAKNTVDELLLKLGAENKEIIVATQDRALKENLKNRRIPCITIRQKKYLMQL